MTRMITKFLQHIFVSDESRSLILEHLTSLEDIELITKMAKRYRDDEIARVLSKLGRKTGKGNRWTQSRVAYARKKYKIPAPDLNQLDSNILTLGQATAYTQVSDTTLMRLIRAEILPVKQVAPLCAV